LVYLLPHGDNQRLPSEGRRNRSSVRTEEGDGKAPDPHRSAVLRARIASTDVTLGNRPSID
jgi:hypothetical protein